MIHNSYQLNSKLLPCFLLTSIIFIALEASIRKYIFASPVLILLKYIPITFLFFVAGFWRRKLPLFLILVALPTLTTIPNIRWLPYSFYDFIAIAILPALAISLLSFRVCMPAFLKYKISRILLILGTLNATLIILQSILGSSHWLSQTVDQNFSQHIFGELQKAPGLQAADPSFFSVAGICAYSYMKLFPGCRHQRFYRSCFFLICLSVFFNLSSRSYFFSIAMMLALMLIYNCYQRPNFLRTILKFSLLLVFLLSFGFVFWFFFADSSLASSILFNVNSNRTFNDFDSAFARLFSLEGVNFLFLNNIPSSLPLLNGLGLGSAINNNPFASEILLPKYCAYEFGVEGEFPRLACSFGFYGYLLVLTRILLGILLLHKSLICLKRQDPTIFLICSFIGILLIDGLQLKANDAASGLLLISLYSLVINSYSSCSLAAESQSATSS